MSKHLDVLSTDLDIALNTANFLCAIKFQESRKAAYPAIVKLCKRAPLYLEAELGEKKKKKFHLAAFDRSREGAKLAYAILEEMRLSSFKYSLFANERIQKNKYALLNMLDCFIQASRCKNKKAHCHMVTTSLFERADTGIKLSFDDDDPEDGPEWILPCKHLDGFLDLSKTKESPKDVLESVAIQRNVNLCPLFDPDEFGPVDDSGPKFWR